MVSNTNKNGVWHDTEIAKQILSKKYYHEGEDFKDFVNRVSGIFSTPELREQVKQAIIDADFLPAGRSLYGAGAKGKFKASMSNCYILPMPEDNLESINKVDYESEVTYSRGGGCGINISNLRPKGAKVNNAARTTTGAVSFINKFNSSAELIGAHGRRAALLVGLNCDHPDIEDFLEIKQNNDKIQGANLSILFTDEFMKAVENSEEYELKFDVEATGEKIRRTINAKVFFEKFCNVQRDWGEPGALFIDNIRQNNLLAGYKEYEINISNPCAEFVGNAYNSCNLGSINLYNMVNNPFTDHASFGWTEFANAVRLGITALDEILDYGYDTQPLPENKKCIDDWRSIGLGVFGLADMFIAMGIKYGSKESVDLVDNIFGVMQEEALWTSMNLAKQKGAFGKYDWEKTKLSPIIHAYKTNVLYKEIEKYGLRNGTLLSIAPTGTIATMTGFSGGIEPLYEIKYKRTTHSLESSGKTFTVYAKSVADLLKSGKRGEGDPEYIVASHQIPWADRIAVQSTIQKYVDNAISSTINLPHEATSEDIFNTYITAWKGGCKGITTFREGCKRASILGKTQEVDQKFNYITPIKSSDKDGLDSRKYVGHTACARNIHINIPNLDGNIFEVFTSPTGGCLSNINAITKLISHNLRCGAKVEDIIEILESNVCPACKTLKDQGNDKISYSCSACIGEALRKEYTRLKGEIKEDNGLSVCPQCGEKRLKPEGRCDTCLSCGYSKCN